MCAQRGGACLSSVLLVSLAFCLSSHYFFCSFIHRSSVCSQLASPLLSVEHRVLCPSHSHSHSHTLSHTVSLSYTLSHTLSLSLTHTLSDTHSLSHTLIHTYCIFLSRSHTQALNHIQSAERKKLQRMERDKRDRMRALKVGISTGSLSWTRFALC